jgi:large subunit ribosomal protein L10
MDKQKKIDVTGDIQKMIDDSSALYLINFTGMTVEQVEDLRGAFFKEEIKYRVVKNTLALRALRESAKFASFAEGLEEFLKGPTGIVFAGDDPVKPAKILKAKTEKSDKPKFKAAVIEGQLYGSDKLDTLAKLLSKNEIIGAICGSLNSPVSGIVGSINAVIRDLASVIEEAAKKKNAA